MKEKDFQKLKNILIRTPANERPLRLKYILQEIDNKISSITERRRALLLEFQLKLPSDASVAYKNSDVPLPVHNSYANLPDWQIILSTYGALLISLLTALYLSSWWHIAGITTGVILTGVVVICLSFLFTRDVFANKHRFFEIGYAVIAIPMVILCIVGGFTASRNVGNSDALPYGLIAWICTLGFAIACSFLHASRFHYHWSDRLADKDRELQMEISEVQEFRFQLQRLFN